VSPTAEAVVGALFAAFAAVIAVLAIRLSVARERIARLEEWTRQHERREGRDLDR
jgi:hypothetical protein